LLSADQLVAVRAAERRENLATCLIGRYPTLCDRSLLSSAERVQVARAESTAASSRPALPSGRSGGYARATGCEDGHWIDSVSDNGRVVTLEDGSTWLVDPVDTVNSALWLPTSEITLCDGKLINTDDEESVEAEALE
jgi:hypothetical protein